MITFYVPTVPVAQPRQRHRAFAMADKIISQNYTPAKHPVNAYKAAVQAAWDARKGETIDGPVGLKLVFVFPRPKHLKKTGIRARHYKKPDCDNLFKSTADALKGLAFYDDAQITWAVTEKWYADGHEQPHVEVTIGSIPS